MSQLSRRIDAAFSGIAETDDALHAWVVVDEVSAQEQVRLVEARLGAGEHLPLAGVTVGIKDIIDVASVPTMAGFEPFARRVAKRDAAAVARLRQAGAIILGKTVTTQFASADPSPTRNPWNLERTPGGSSAGSAAAVAARQVDIALGTQTGGSVLRPSAFCGIVGFKPGYGWTSTSGVLPLAVSLDTIGIHARSVAEAARVYDVLARPDLPRSGSCEPIGPARIGIWADAVAHAQERMRAGVIDAIEHLANDGAIVVDAVAPVSFDNLSAIHAVIIRAEAAAAHSELFARHMDDYLPSIRATVETGMALPVDVYVRALRLREQVRAEIMEAWSKFDLIAIPASESAAPDLSTTGNPALLAIATLLGFPSLTLPIGFNPEYLPLGIQLIGTHPGDDVRLLRLARWVESHMPRLPRPPHAVGRN